MKNKLSVQDTHLKNESELKFFDSSHPRTAHVLVISVSASVFCLSSGATLAKTFAAINNLLTTYFFT